MAVLFPTLRRLSRSGVANDLRELFARISGATGTRRFSTMRKNEKRLYMRLLLLVVSSLLIILIMFSLNRGPRRLQTMNDTYDYTAETIGSIMGDGAKWMGLDVGSAFTGEQSLREHARMKQVYASSGWNTVVERKGENHDDVVHIAMIFDNFRKSFVRSVMRSTSWHNRDNPSFPEDRAFVYHLIAPASLHESMLSELQSLHGRWKAILYDFDEVCDPWVAKVWFTAKAMHKSAMCKMFLAEILPKTFPRVLFLDSDSTVIGRISPCWFGPKEWGGVTFEKDQYIGMGTDMGATCQFDPDQCYPVGFEWKIPKGLICGTVPYRSAVYAKDKRLCRNPGDTEPYQFNSGVLLMDLDKMRRDNFVDKFIRTSVTTWRNIEHKQAKWGDQCLINNFLRFYPETLHELPCGCNYQYSAERREVKCPNRTVTIAHGWNKQMADEASKDSYNIHFRFFRDNIPSDKNIPPVPRLRSMISADWNATLNEKSYTATCPHQSFTCTEQDRQVAESAPFYQDDRVNILTRTAKRPRFFRENVASVLEQTHKKINHLILTDDPESVGYIRQQEERIQNTERFSHELIPSLYKDFDPDEVCRKCSPRNSAECARAPPPSAAFARKMYFKCFCRTNYPMNTYFDTLHRRAEDGWVLYLDDDNVLQDKFAISELLANVHSDNEMLIYRSTLGRVTPLDENFGKRIVAGDFDASNFMYHSRFKEYATWGNQRCGDYRAGSNLAKYLPQRWIDWSFVQSNPLRAELGGLGARGEISRTGFTVVITSYQADGWRPRWLNETISTYLSEEYSVVIDRIILVWNNMDEPPPSILPLKNERLHIIRPSKNSLNNRWELTSKLVKTSAVLNLDDDLYITLPAIICMFNWHLRHPKSLMGPFVRRIDETGAYVLNELHDSSEFSMVLPRALVVPFDFLHQYSKPEFSVYRKYVDDQEAHCDDVLLNLVSQKISPTPPIRIAIPPSSLVDYYMTCYPQNKELTGGLGLQSFRSERRTDCVRHFLKDTGLKFKKSKIIGTCLPRGNAFAKVTEIPKDVWGQMASKHVQCVPA